MSKKAATINDELEQLYAFEKREQVLNYIKQNSVLTELLLEAPEKIQAYFSDAPLALKMFINQETVDDMHLIIFITSRFTPRETLDKLDQLEDDWGDEVLQKSQGKLSINIDFA